MLFLDLSLFASWLFKINFFRIVVILILRVLRVAFVADVAQKVLDCLWENLICYCQANLYQLSVKAFKFISCFQLTSDGSVLHSKKLKKLPGSAGISSSLSPASRGYNLVSAFSASFQLILVT